MHLCLAKKKKTKTKKKSLFCIFKGKSELHKIPTQHKAHEGISAANQKKIEHAYHIALSEKIKAEIGEVNGGVFPLITGKCEAERIRKMLTKAK